MENNELAGFWWLPTNPENKLAGIFTHTKDNKIQLSLIGSFESTGVLPEIDTQYPVIFGITNKQRITLVDCSVINSSMSMLGFSSQECHIQMAFIGGHFHSPAGNLFNKVEVQYTYLTDWIGGMRFESQTVPTEDEQNEYCVKCLIPRPVSITTQHASVSINYNLLQKRNGFLNLDLAQQITLEIRVTDDLTFRELLSRFVYPLQNFLTLATNKPNALTSTDVYSNQEVLCINNTSIPGPIQVIFQQTYYGEERKEKPPLFNMLFAFEDVKDRFGEVVQRWLDIFEDFETTCNLYFGIQYQKQVYLEQKFLSIAQAVESYHRHSSKFETRVLSKDEHKKRKEEICKCVPDEYKSWLTEKLAFSNEPSLRERLQELIDSVKDSIEPLLGNTKTFIGKVVSTRNYLTHYDHSGKKKATQGVNLFWLIQGLSFLLQACFLSELGFSSEQSAKLISRNSMFRLVKDKLGNLS